MTQTKGKKEDRIESLLKKSARARVAMLGHHFNIKEAIDIGMENKANLTPLKEEEVAALLDSFTSEKDIEIYISYRNLNIKVISSYRWLLYLASLVSNGITKLKLYKLLYTYEDSSQAMQDQISVSLSDLLVKLEDFVCYYSALRQYMEFFKYKDKYVTRIIREVGDRIQAEINGTGDADVQDAIDEAMKNIDKEKVLIILKKEFRTHEN